MFKIYIKFRKEPEKKKKKNDFEVSVAFIVVHTTASRRTQKRSKMLLNVLKRIYEQ